MAIARWTTPTALSANLAPTALNGLANNGESAPIIYDNSTNRDLYCSVTILLGSVTPIADGSVLLRIWVGDGTNAPTTPYGDVSSPGLTTTTGTKVIIFPMIQLYPLSMRFSVINMIGVAFAMSGNGLYIRTWNEEIL